MNELNNDLISNSIATILRACAHQDLVCNNNNDRIYAIYCRQRHRYKHTNAYVRKCSTIWLKADREKQSCAMNNKPNNRKIVIIKETSEMADL